MLAVSDTLSARLMSEKLMLVSGRQSTFIHHISDNGVYVIYEHIYHTKYAHIFDTLCARLMSERLMLVGGRQSIFIHHIHCDIGVYIICEHIYHYKICSHFLTLYLVYCCLRY